jgi:hypothetical protein
MKTPALLLAALNFYKTHSSVILAIASGLAMILTKNYGGGISEIFQALALIFGGASVVGLGQAVAQLSASVQGGTSPTGAADAGQAAKVA